MIYLNSYVCILSYLLILLAIFLNFYFGFCRTYSFLLFHPSLNTFIANKSITIPPGPAQVQGGHAGVWPTSPHPGLYAETNKSPVGAHKDGTVKYGKVRGV